MRPLILTADYGPDTWSGIGTAVTEQARALAAMPGFGGVVLAGGPRLRRPPPDPFVRPLTGHRCPVRPAGFDLVHLHSLPLGGLAWQLRRRYGLPLVYTAHSLLHHELAGQPAAGWAGVQRAVLCASDHVIFVSRAERDAALAWLPGLAGRCSVLPHGIRPRARTRRVPPDGPIVFAGRFTAAKGIVLFGEIVRRLAPAGRHRFVAAGGRPDATGRAVAEDLRRRRWAGCRLPGWLSRPAMDALLDRAALVLVPSRYEPFGMTALEAQSRGVPVLAAAVGGLPEVITPGSGGRLVHSADPRAWCRSIERVLRSPRLYRRLSRRGPAHVALRHDPAALAHRLVAEIYLPLLAGSEVPS